MPVGNRFAYLLFGGTALLWVITGAVYFTEPAAPYEAFGVDTVTPPKVVAGSNVSISRTFRITYLTHMTVTRTMIKGNCTKSCEILDLRGGGLALEPGEYNDATREHQIPPNASPGIWVLQFAVHWESRLGQPHSLKLPPLQIEVLPKPS